MLFQQFQDTSMFGTIVGNVLGIVIGVGINTEISEIGIEIRILTTVITLIIKHLLSSRSQEIQLARSQEIQLGMLPGLFSQMLDEEYQRHLIDFRKSWFEASNSIPVVEINTAIYFLSVICAEIVDIFF